jgi:hypothetical protein
MRVVSSILLVTAVIAVALVPAAAQERIKPNFKDLLAQGYEIKNVTFIPLFALKSADATPENPQVLVTLQKGPASAVCQYSLNGWANQSRRSLDSHEQCDTFP